MNWLAIIIFYTFYISHSNELHVEQAKRDELVNKVADDAEEEKVSYSGSQLWKVATGNDNKKLNILIKLRDARDLSMWGGNVTEIDVLVNRNSLQKVKNELDTANINFEVIINDLQKAIDVENPAEIELDDRIGHRLTWSAYHRLSDIYGYLDHIADAHGDLVRVETVGRSVQGRPIRLVKISNGRAGNRAVWVDGGIHAREWISPATVTYLINHLILNYDAESAAVRGVDWYIAPVLNPDGYEYTHTVDRLWRKNRARHGACRGTDLNRNFGYRWGGKGSAKSPCAETYGGAGAFSEPETQALRQVIMSSGADFRAYLSFHSYGQYVLYPWGYDRAVPPDHKDLEGVGRKMVNAMRQAGAPFYKLGPAASTLYPAAGGSDDWAKGVARIKYAYTIELRDSGRYGFVLPASFIQPTAKEALAAVRVVAEAVQLA